MADGAHVGGGSIADTDTFAALAADADVVVVSVPPDRTGGPAEPMVEAHRRLIAARPDARLLVVGGDGSLVVGGSRLVDAPEFPDAYKPESLAFSTILDDYRASSGLDWTVVSPSPMIAPGDRTGYVLGTDSPVGDSVTTSDFADAIVDELETPT